MQTTTRPGLPLAEYMRRYDEDGPFEIIDGEIVPMTPTKFGHSYLTRLLFLALHNFVSAGGQWEVFSETAFIKPGVDDPNWVEGSFVPDVMLIRADRVAAYTAANADWREKPLPIVPELAIEIVSPTDRYSEVYKKIERYFERGVLIIWLIDPQRKKVSVHRAGADQQTILGENGTLTGCDLLPGFEIAVKSLFE
jgi:Uma2 family endonuclease